MIIPTPEFDPLFADEGVPFKSRMLQYIHNEFGGMPEVQSIYSTEQAEDAILAALSNIAGNEVNSATRKRAA